MKKLLARGIALAVLLGVVAVFTTTADAEDKKAKTIKEVMALQGKSKGAITAAVKAEKWDDASTAAKAWLAGANDLGMNKPPKGEDDAWKKNCGKYVDTITAVSAAIDKKDAPGVTKALNIDCMGCHSAHKGGKK